MKPLTIMVLVGLLSLGLAANVWGADNAGKAGAAAPAVAPPAAPAAPGTAAPNPSAKETRAERLADEVKTQVAAAEKLLKLCDDELAKPKDKQDAKKILGLKMTAAQTYLRAAGRAKSGAGMLAKDERETFLQQYEQPNRSKAISILLELAAAAKDMKDYRDAVGFYKGILQIDPENVTAQAALKLIQEELNTAKADAAKARNGGGGGSDNRIDNMKPWQGYKDAYTGYNNWHQNYGTNGNYGVPAK
jgi:tetratricopeptide (TPR) repeat protein